MKTSTAVDLTRRKSGKQVKEAGTRKKGTKLDRRTAGPSRAKKGLGPVSEVEIESIVLGQMLGLQSAVAETGHHPFKFRSSNAPFCPFLLAGDTLKPTANYTEQHFFDVGTAIHNLIQNAMGISVNRSKMYGDWGCACKVPRGHAPKHLKKGCTKPRKPCPEGKDWLYRETELEYKGLTGHVDTILEFTRFHPGGRAEKCYIVVDYKTAHLPLVKDSAGRWFQDVKQEDFPKPPNVAQISFYCTILKERGLNVVGWALIYVDRGRPIRTGRDVVIRAQAWTDQRHKRWKARLDLACEAAPFARKAMDRRMKGKLVPKTLLVDMALRRPCVKPGDYDRYMSAAFHYAESECPCVKKCERGRKGDNAVVKYFAEQWGSS